jgi:hypothetical protein
VGRREQVLNGGMGLVGSIGKAFAFFGGHRRVSRKRLSGNGIVLRH